MIAQVGTCHLVGATDDLHDIQQNLSLECFSKADILQGDLGEIAGEGVDDIPGGVGGDSGQLALITVPHLEEPAIEGADKRRRGSLEPLRRAAWQVIWPTR